MPTGAGSAPAGSSIAGYGAVDTAAAPPTQIYIDSSDGSQQNARKINPVTGDYTLTTYGRAEGMPGVRQRVLIAVKTVRDSAAVKNLGNGALLIKKRGRNVEKQIEDALRLAMKRLVDDGVAKIVGFDFANFGFAGVYCHMRWRDLTTNVEHVDTV